MQQYHKLKDREIEVLSLLLYYEHELRLSVNDPDLVTRLLFSSQTRKRMRDELGDMKGNTFNNLLSALRKKNILTKDNKFNNSLVPPMSINDKSFQLVFNFEEDGSNKK